MTADPYQVYAHREKGLGTRRWIEMVGELHRLGYGRLRLACSWEDAGPAPVWFGEIVPGSYFRKDHGAILARHPFPSEVQQALRDVNPNAYPMFTSRWCTGPDYPWPGFISSSITECAEKWVAQYAQLASEGAGEDIEYVEWYARMLRTTAPTGIISAYCYEYLERAEYMDVSCGPAGCDRFDLPPPGTADSA
jgi:hypothetical protein